MSERDPDPTTVTGTGTGSPAESVGPYRLLRRLGVGGMGEVWEAEQERPVRRRVALKLIRIGLDSAIFIARFQSERQALALMGHPNIARVFDAGSSDDGRPYFVMELVSGPPITDYCDRRRLTVRERVELFCGVLDGVQHAHQKGILHRDLKPSNVLVTEIDGRAVPKVIDFGLAKATAQPLSDASVHTEVGQLVGTPEYMSPEQADSSGLDVDTRSDVYSLGALLYALVSGCLPFEFGREGRSSLADLLRRLRDEEPSRPSARIAGAGREAHARSRSTSPAALAAELAHDLDWIVLRAMEKDRARRYGSPAELAADLRRYLADEPVDARPPSLGYRLGKFVRRHRLAVGATCVVALALLLGAAGTIVGLWRARQAEARALNEAATARQISGFLVDLFEVSEPERARGSTITAREILDRGAASIRERLGEQPLVRARLLDTIGEVYRKLGMLTESAALVEESLALRESRPDTPAGEIEESLLHAGALRAERGNLPGARDAIERGLELRRTRLGPHETAVAEAYSALGMLEFRAGNFAAAQRALESALAIDEQARGVEDATVGGDLDMLAAVLDEQGLHDDARPLYERAIRILELRLGPDHPDLAGPLSNLALNLKTTGHMAEARPIYERALAIDERVLGPDHPSLATTLQNLAALDLAEGRWSEAGRQLARALAIRERALGPDHPDVAYTLEHLGDLRWRGGEYDAARGLGERALSIRERALGNAHPALGVTLRLLAATAWKQGRAREAERDFARALTIQRAAAEGDTVEVARTLAYYGCWLAEAGQTANARTTLERALAVLPPDLTEVGLARRCREHLPPG